MTTSTRSGVVDFSGISLCALLGKAFGGSTGLVDVGIHRYSHDQALHPYGDECVPVSNVTAAASKTGHLHDHGKYHSVTQVQILLLFEPKLLVTGEPVFPEAANRRSALERHPRCAPFPDGVGGVEAHHRVKVMAITSLKQAAVQLHQVGGRGLLRHHPASIPRRPRGGGPGGNDVPLTRPTSREKSALHG